MFNKNKQHPFIEYDETVTEDVMVEDEVMDAPVESENDEGLPPVCGVVCDCPKLNVRKAPSTDAGIVCTIARDTNVVIDRSKSNDEWYFVCTETGVEGFCMTKYISVRL